MEDNDTDFLFDTRDDADKFMMKLWRSRFRFYLFLALQFPSFCCNIPILYYFKWKYLKNQIYGFLIIINALIVIAELPITLYFLYQGRFLSDYICTSWITLNYSLFIMSSFMMAWTSIERYLFIYHEHMIIQHKILLHYFPIIFIILYCPLFYIGVIILYPCKPAYNIQSYVCGGACYETKPIIGTIDSIVNRSFIAAITFIVNIILIVRYLIQRHRMKGAIITASRRQKLRRSIKLSTRLLLVGILYMTAWIPYSIAGIIQIYHYTDQLEDLLTIYFAYFPYIQALFLPYICILFIPEIKGKLFALLKCKNQIYPINHQQRQLPLNYQH